MIGQIEKELIPKSNSELSELSKEVLNFNEGEATLTDTLSLTQKYSEEIERSRNHPDLIHFQNEDPLTLEEDNQEHKHQNSYLSHDSDNQINKKISSSSNSPPKKIVKILKLHKPRPAKYRNTFKSIITTIIKSYPRIHSQVSNKYPEYLVKYGKQFLDSLASKKIVIKLQETILKEASKNEYLNEIITKALQKKYDTFILKSKHIKSYNRRAYQKVYSEFLNRLELFHSTSENTDQISEIYISKLLQNSQSD